MLDMSPQNAISVTSSVIYKRNKNLDKYYQ